MTRSDYNFNINNNKYKCNIGLIYILFTIDQSYKLFKGRLLVGCGEQAGGWMGKNRGCAFLDTHVWFSIYR